MSKPSLQDVGDQIASAYSRKVVVTVRDDRVNLMIYGVDLSDAPKSKPDGKVFKTLDNPEQHIPESIRRVVDSTGYSMTVLGHGPGENGSLHVHVL